MPHPSRSAAAPRSQRLTCLVGVALASAALSGCTTSRAVVAWHQGWQAEEAGDLQLAEQRYGEAAAADKAQAGAACNQLRLVARHPDRAEQAKSQLEVLVKAKPAWPEVASTAALAALYAGDAKLAQQRLQASRPLNDADRADVRHALRFAKVATAAVQGRWREATDDKLLAGLPQEATAARLAAAAAAYNGGDKALAGRLLPAAAPDQAANAAPMPVAVIPAAAAELRAWLAAEAGQWPAVRQALDAVPQAERTPRQEALRAWSLLRAGEAAAGLALAADAARRDPNDAVVTQVWAAALLASGQPQLARDLLAGLAARGGGWTVWFDLGLAQLALADPQAALGAFEQAVARCPSCAPALKNREALRRIATAP